MSAQRCAVIIFLGLLTVVAAHARTAGATDAAKLRHELKAGSSRVAAQHATAATNLSTSTPEMEVVRHQKKAGNGYLEGSPLYAKQQAVKHGEPASGGAGGGAVPVSTAMKCVINLTVQFVIVYTALFVVQTMNKYAGDDKPLRFAQEILEGAKETVRFVPMLAVLFIAVRMRAVQLSQGQTEQHDLPQGWVKNSMIVCSWSVLGQTIFAVAYALVTRTPYEADGLVAPQNKAGTMAIVFSVCRYLLMLGIYVGFTLCCVGLFVMQGPEEIWEGKTPKTSPAVRCVMLLTLFYFGAQLALTIARTANDLRSTPLRFGHGIDILQLAADAVLFAPMLAILFLAARMRALQIDSKHGNPQSWAQSAMYVATIAMLIQVVCVLVSFVTGVPAKMDEFGEVIYEENVSGAGKAVEIVKLVAMAIMMISTIVVVVSIAVIEHPEGPDKTPKVSPAVGCVIFLASFYFIIHAATWICLAIRKRSGKLTAVAEYLWGPARESVDFCPILCVLFVGTRMRALQLTNGLGAPQGWAQQCMYMASWAVFFQALAKIDVLLERVMQKPLPKVAKIILTVISFLALLLMYVGAVAIIVALFYMTPESANGAGSLIPGANIPPPPAR